MLVSFQKNKMNFRENKNFTSFKILFLLYYRYHFKEM